MFYIILYCSSVYLRSMLHQLHPPIFQVDETDSHPPQQLQMLRIVCHEILSSERRLAHTGLPEGREVSRSREK